MATMMMDVALPRSSAMRPRATRAREAQWGPGRDGQRTTASRTARVPARAGVHLTVRGRRVLFAGAVLVATAAAFLVMALFHTAPVSAFTGHAGGVAAENAAPVHSVVVHQGDTLWAIAGREMPGVDPVEAVGRIRAVNALTPTDALVAGSVIAIPAA